jgi:hypothetical protein
MHDSITSSIVSVFKFIFYWLLWSMLLLNLGRVALLAVTFGRYPRGLDVRRHANQISFVGALVLVLAWSSIAIFNNTLGAHA